MNKTKTKNIDRGALFRDGPAVDRAVEDAVRAATNPPPPTHHRSMQLAISELFRDGRALDLAVRAAVREAIASEPLLCNRCRCRIKAKRSIGEIFDDGRTVERAVKMAVRDVVGPQAKREKKAAFRSSSKTRTTRRM